MTVAGGRRESLAYLLLEEGVIILSVGDPFAARLYCCSYIYCSSAAMLSPTLQPVRK
jgi:hypothetical protein